MLVALLLTGFVVATAAGQSLVIRFFDVGQGDAALVVSPEGKSVLVDGGPDDDTVLQYLKQLNIDTLDLVVASHNHADHIRGLPSVLRSIVVRNYMDNGVPATTAVYQSVLDALIQDSVPYLNAVPRIVHLGSVDIRVLARPPDIETQNNSSVGLLLTYGKFKALFTGDAEFVERDFWRLYAEVAVVDLLKVAHHGSINGTDSLWTMVTRPCIAVISVGEGNRYGHPSPETLRSLQESGALVYRTDEVGTITVVVTVDGTIAIRTERGGLRYAKDSTLALSEGAESPIRETVSDSGERHVSRQGQRCEATMPP